MRVVPAVQHDQGIEAIPWWWWGLLGLGILTMLLVALAWLLRERPTP